MPTGHTAKILKGCTFEEFVWSCARSMGFMIHMKESPMDAPISINSAHFFDNEYYRTQVDKLTQELEVFLGFSDDDWKEYLENKYNEEINRRIENRKRKNKDKQTYEAMLEKVVEWNVPDGFDFLKEYLTSQIEDSISHDCFDSKYDDPGAVERSSKEAVLKGVKKDLKYNKEQLEKEQERHSERLTYIRTLNQSVPRPAHLIPEDEK